MALTASKTEFSAVCFFILAPHLSTQLNMTTTPAFMKNKLLQNIAVMMTSLLVGKFPSTLHHDPPWRNHVYRRVRGSRGVRDMIFSGHNFSFFWLDSYQITMQCELSVNAGGAQGAALQTIS